MSGMDLFILIGLVLFLVCALGVFLLTIWAAGRNSNRGHWDY
jgi:hypothetical protein